MDKLYAIKIKKADGTYGSEIPISALAENITWDDYHTLVDVLGYVDTSTSIQAQINNLVGTKANQNDLNLLQTRVDNLIAPSGQAPNAAEIQDARIGENNVTYNTLGTAIRKQVSDLKNKIDDEHDLINNAHSYVNYGYDIPFYQEANPSSSSVIAKIGVYRNKNIVVLNKDVLSYDIRLRLSGECVMVTSNAAVEAWSSGITLKGDHEYAVTVKILSGTCNYNNETLNVAPTVSVYELGTHVSVGTYETLDDGTTIRTFTATTNTQYNFALYLNRQCYICINARLLITLEDLTENKMLQMEQNINTLSTEIEETNNYNRIYMSRLGEINYTKPIEVTTLISGGVNSTTGYSNGSAYNLIRCKTKYIPISSNLHISLGLDNYIWTIFVYASASQNSGTHSGMATAGYANANIDVFTDYFVTDKYIRISFERIDGAEMNTDTTDPTSDYSIILSALKIYGTKEIDNTTVIESFYQEEMQSTIQTVRNCQTEPCLVFPLITDIHYASDTADGDAYLFTKETNFNIRRFSEEVQCDGIFCLGDIHDGGYNSVIPSSLKNAEEISSMLLNKMRNIGIPLYFSIGNHDDCRYMDPNWMLIPQIYSTYMSQSNKDVVFDTNYYGLNYYKDFSQFGTRLIEINTNLVPTNSQKGRYGVSTQTLNFLESALSSMQNGWMAIIITHCPVIDTLYTESASAVYHIEEVVNKITASGKIAIVLAGHMHYDISTVNPFVHVVTAANKNSLRDENENIITKGTEIGKVYIRQLETGTKDLWDIVVLRPFSRILDFIRFGSGVNRRFYITPITPTTVTTELSGTITWASSNTAVATVIDGVITGVATGTCAVTATDEIGNFECWTVTIS